MIERVKRWALALKLDIAALSLALADRDVHIGAKAVIALIVTYALSPIDLIPDFIPVLGYLDDLLILPLGIALAIRMIGPAKMTLLRSRAAATDRPGHSFWGAAMVVAIWLSVLLGVVYWLF